MREFPGTAATILSARRKPCFVLQRLSPQIVQRVGIKSVGFVFDCTDAKGLPADAVHQYHHAETAPEIGGIHDDVGFGRLREGFPDAHLAQMAVDGFTATAVLRGELGGSLLACAVVRPKFIALATPATVKLPAAVAVFIALLAVVPPILFGFFRSAEKAFLCSKVLIPLKGLQHKTYSVFEPTFCPIRC